MPLRRRAIGCSSNQVLIGINKLYITVIDCIHHELLLCQRVADCIWARTPE